MRTFCKGGNKKRARFPAPLFCHLVEPKMGSWWTLFFIPTGKSSLAMEELSGEAVLAKLRRGANQHRRDQCQVGAERAKGTCE